MPAHQTARTLTLLALMLALVAPALAEETIVVSHEPVSLALTLDLSGSMKTADIKGEGGELISRWAAARAALLETLPESDKLRASVIVFAQDPYTLAPLSSDLDFIRKTLSKTKVGDIPATGAALGMALGLSIKRLQAAEESHRYIVVITDGEPFVGHLSVGEMAAFAKRAGIRVYPVFVGDKARIGPLQKLADDTGGALYEARSQVALGKALSAIFVANKGKTTTTKFIKNR